jgi:hypothetical protein
LLKPKSGETDHREMKKDGEAKRASDNPFVPGFKADDWHNGLGPARHGQRRLHAPNIIMRTYLGKEPLRAC